MKLCYSQLVLKKKGDRQPKDGDVGQPVIIDMSENDGWGRQVGKGF